MSNEPVRRRDWLVTAAFATAGVGGVMALWPFVAALGPDAETLARRVTFDTKVLNGTTPVSVNVHNRPVAVFRRTAEELAWLRDPSVRNGVGAPVDFDGRTFRDRDSASPQQPIWATNWHRSLRTEIMVHEGMCTRGDCVLSTQRVLAHAIMCPCCGSRYDLAGRAYFGPASSNLRVPPYRFVDETTIEFLTAEVLATQA